MDKTAKYLRYIRRHGPNIPFQKFAAKFGGGSQEIIDTLLRLGYIVSLVGKPSNGKGGEHAVGKYTISETGRVFLDRSGLGRFDRWATRIGAAIGAVTGIISLLAGAGAWLLSLLLPH